MKRIFLYLSLALLFYSGMGSLSFAQNPDVVQKNSSENSIFKGYFFLYGGAGFLPGIESMFEDEDKNTEDKSKTIPVAGNIYGGFSSLFFTGQSEGIVFGVSYHFERIYFQTFLKESNDDTGYEFNYPYKVIQIGIGKGYYDSSRQSLAYFMGGIKIAIADSSQKEVFVTPRGVEVITPENLYGAYVEAGGVFGEPLSVLVGLRMGIYFGGYDSYYLKPFLPVTFELILGLGFSF